jgi:hypothetical protein
LDEKSSEIPLRGETILEITRSKIAVLFRMISWIVPVQTEESAETKIRADQESVTASDRTVHPEVESRPATRVVRDSES